MEIHRLLKEFVRETLREKEEAPKGAQLGSYAFPDKRQSEDLPDEPNTQKEDELFDALKRHIVNNEYLPPNDSKLIQKFLQNGWYSSIFSPPEQGVVFRGMSMSTKELEGLLGGEMIPDISGKKKIKHTYKPRSGGGSSWTTSIEKAWEFANLYTDDEKRWPVIIRASSRENPISFVSGNPSMGGKGVYSLEDVTGGTGFESEDEVFGLGQIQVNEVEWDGPEDLKDQTVAGTEEGWD